jgi:hypothetical protein
VPILIEGVVVMKSESSKKAGLTLKRLITEDPEAKMRISIKKAEETAERIVCRKERIDSGFPLWGTGFGASVQ